MAPPATEVPRRRYYVQGKNALDLRHRRLGSGPAWPEGGAFRQVGEFTTADRKRCLLSAAAGGPAKAVWTLPPRIESLPQRRTRHGAAPTVIVVHGNSCGCCQGGTSLPSTTKPRPLLCSRLPKPANRKQPSPVKDPSHPPQVHNASTSRHRQTRSRSDRAGRKAESRPNRCKSGCAQERLPRLPAPRHAVWQSEQRANSCMHLWLHRMLHPRRKTGFGARGGCRHSELRDPRPIPRLR